MGAAGIVRVLKELGARDFFVCTPEEAQSIQNGNPEIRLYILDGLRGKKEQGKFCAEQSFVPVLNGIADIRVWQDTACALGKKLPAILHIDTGMNRMGADKTELCELAAQDYSNIDIQWLMSHFATAHPEGNALMHKQYARFIECTKLFPAHIPRMLANSAAGLGEARWQFDAIRAGIALYGVLESSLHEDLHPALRLEAELISIRHVAKGDSVSYGASWTAQRKSRIAVAAIGYADGYLRSASNRAKALIGGRLCPVAGSVTMDYTMFDITDIESERPPSHAVLFGPGYQLPEFAHDAGSIAHEILAGLGPRVKRVIHNSPYSQL